LRDETRAICRSLALARATFETAIAEKPAGRFMIRQRTEAAPISAGWSERLADVGNLDRSI